MCLLPYDHRKFTVHGSRDEEMWPQLHFTHDKPSLPSTVGAETLESTQKSLGDLSR